MKRFISSVKIKVLLGYFTLVILGSLMIWVTYSEIKHYTGEEVDLNPVNNKFIYINNILTNLYEAEGLESSFARTGQTKHYRAYVRLMDSISWQIDTLASMVNSPIRQIHTDSIKKLLQEKQQNLKELAAIKKENSPTVRYQQALKKLAAGKDSIDPILKVTRNVTTNLDSIYIKVKKRNFFERLANVFSSPKSADSALQIRTIQSVRTDSIVNPVNPADTIAGLITAVITQIKDDSIAMQSRLKQKEEEILSNDRTITHQIRQMLSGIENEEFMNSFNKVNDQQNRIQRKTALIIFVGILSLITVIFFLVNILKDITRSHHYRQSLEEAKAFTESLLRSKEQLMLSLTHDLKSPLSSVIGYTQFMQERVDIPPQHRTYLQNISKASEHMLKLINDLLDFAHLDTGKFTIDHISFKLESLVEEIVGGFRPQAKAKNIDLTLDYTIPPPLMYKSDPVRITQILSNLISNAIKFTDEGRVSVEVSLIKSSEKSDTLRFDIADTGIGISAEDTNRIFEEFTRVTTSAKHYEGTGLGLTITKKLISLMDGTITLESKPGEGSRFSVLLPLERVSSEEESETINLQSREKTDSTGTKIWVIDDDETLIAMITSILVAEGLDVQSFSDPQKAIKAYEKGCASVLITDIQMPGMSGIELLKKIQEKDGGPIRSVAMTGSPSEVTISGDFSAVVLKPFKPRTLIDVVNEQLRKTKASPVSEVHHYGYDLKQLAAFAGDDPDTLRQILVSFISTGQQNVTLFRQYLQDGNYNALSELSHKMLTLFRQLEAFEIAELLSQLETKNIDGPDQEQYLLKGTFALEKIEQLLYRIQAEENIQVD